MWTVSETPSLKRPRRAVCLHPGWTPPTGGAADAGYGDAYFRKRLEASIERNKEILERLAR